MADETPVASGPEVISVSDFLEADQDSSSSAEPAQPEPTAQAAQEPVEAQPAAVAGTQAEPVTPTPPTAAPPPEIVTYRGQRIDLSQIPEQFRESVRAAATSAEQLPSLQEKYTGLLEQVRLAAQVPPPAAPEPRSAPQVSPTQVREAYVNRIKEAIDRGNVSADFYEMYPQEVSEASLTRDLSVMANQRIGKLEAQLAGQMQAGELDRFVSEHDATITRVAGEDPFYSPLNDQTVRTGFKDFLVKFNPPLSQANDPLFLKKMFVAYQSDAVLAAVQAAGKQNADSRGQQKRNAQGEAPRTRPSPKAPPPPGSQAALMDAFMAEE